MSCIFNRQYYDKIKIYFQFVFVFLQQILFHLSQFTPRRHTIRLKESKSDRKTNKTAQNKCEILCQESLHEAVRNWQNSTNATILEIPLTAITKQKSLTGSHTQTRGEIRRLDRLESNIRMSYVSKSTFRENKAEPMSDARQINTIDINHPKIFLIASNLVHQLSQPMLRNSMQIRGFRTQRNVESQLKRNPTFLSRFQQTFGMCFCGVLSENVENGIYLGVQWLILIFSAVIKSRFSDSSIEATPWNFE